VIRSCRDDALFPVGSVELYDNSGIADVDQRPECGVRHVGAPGSNIADWTYGARPPGFAISQCRDLVEGRVYAVQAFRPLTKRRFKLGENGRIEPIDPYCAD
jgi:hypothetical protein